jgi:insulysin
MEMTSEEFERHKEALAAQRLEKPKKLSVLSARFWAEITTQQYNFDRANIEVAHLRGLQKKDILDFFKVMNHQCSRSCDRLDMGITTRHTEFWHINIV